jgi:hypothetical protein
MLLTALGGCVSVKDNSVSLAAPTSVSPDQGLLILVINSSTGFQRLKFKRPGDVFETVAAMDIPPGRSIRLISIPPGNYYWDRMEFQTVGRYVHFVDFGDGDKNLAFTVKAGTVSYAGDLYIEWEDNGYGVHLLNHTAMLLGDLSLEQKGLIDKYGLSFTGKGSDRFFDYYQSLPAQAQVTK